eukprot:4235253-Heterocapsa_arctica.AAC.1
MQMYGGLDFARALDGRADGFRRPWSPDDWRRPPDGLRVAPQQPCVDRGYADMDNDTASDPE